MKKNSLLLVLLLAFAVIVQGLIDEKAKVSPDQWQQQLVKYAEIYSLINDYYPEPVDIEKLFFASIRGFLSTLDPHSYFLDPVASLRKLTGKEPGIYLWMKP